MFEGGRGSQVHLHSHNTEILLASLFLLFLLIVRIFGIQIMPKVERRNWNAQHWVQI